MRTNTQENDYNTIIILFKKRLQQRGYPATLVNKYTAIVKFSQRQQLLQTHPTRALPKTPIFSCLPPPHFNQLKVIILDQYIDIQKTVPRPKFIHKRHKTLGQELVKAKITPSDEQLIDISLALNPPSQTEHISLPKLQRATSAVIPCQNSRCATCTTHLICNSSFKCTKTQITFPIRHTFTCKTSHVVYLITCTKCHKQYVGMTTRQLNIRISQHRTNIMRRIPIYISKHFNLPNHSLENLKVQPIDRATSIKELQQLEHFWIKSLKTLQPAGLNVKP